MCPAPWEMSPHLDLDVSGHTGALWGPASLLPYSILALPMPWLSLGQAKRGAVTRWTQKLHSLVRLRNEKEEKSLFGFK